MSCAPSNAPVSAWCACGSHHHLWREGKRRLVTVPYHGRDLRPSRVKEIAKQAGLTIEEFLKLM